MLTGRPTDYAFIYCLIDPLSGDVRYVGKANDVMKRYASHIKDSGRRMTPVYSWIRSLTKIGEAPLVATLSRCPAGRWREFEASAIAEHRKTSKLLNVADGGDEPACPVEVRRKNGATVAKSIHSNAKGKKAWRLKHMMGICLKDDSIGTECKDRIKAKLRMAASLNPMLFGGWASL